MIDLLRRNNYKISWYPMFIVIIITVIRKIGIEKFRLKLQNRTKIINKKYADIVGSNFNNEIINLFKTIVNLKVIVWTGTKWNEKMEEHNKADRCITNELCAKKTEKNAPVVYKVVWEQCSLWCKWATCICFKHEILYSNEWKWTEHLWCQMKEKNASIHIHIERYMQDICLRFKFKVRKNSIHKRIRSRIYLIITFENKTTFFYNRKRIYIVLNRKKLLFYCTTYLV